MVYTYTLTAQQEEFYNITPQVREAVAKSDVTDGIAIIFCPHTTAGITINENADPDVIPDLLLGLDRAFPNRPEFRHGEGNSAAHLKASAVGSSATVIIEQRSWRWVYGRESISASSTRRGIVSFT